MQSLNEAALASYTLRALGLPAEVSNLTSVEAIAASLRRAAGFLCPCPRRTFVRAVEVALSKQSTGDADLGDTVEDVLDGMVAYGDLLEEREVAPPDRAAGGLLVYAAPPSFVWRTSGVAFLFGIIADRCSPLPPDLERRVEYVNHTRRIAGTSGEDLRAALKRYGLLETSDDAWLRLPPAESSGAHIVRLDRSLRPVVGDIPDLVILDPEQSVRYYRGRWVPAKRQTGRFVARRPQRYGAPLWCYVELDAGQPIQLVDLPLAGSVWRGCDEAWQLQAAIDAKWENPQRFDIRPGVNAVTGVLAFFSPVPAWARRRWDVLGRPIESRASLFAYAFVAGELDQELAFATTRLWLAESGQ